MSTVIVANVPAACTENEIKEFFSPAGIVSKVTGPECKTGATNKIVYVTFANEDESKFAVGKLNKAVLNGNRLTVRLAYTNKSGATGKEKKKKKKGEKEEGKAAEKQNKTIPQESSPVKLIKEIKTETPDESEIHPDSSKINRKARLIVRNLSFKASEEDVKKHFGKFGQVSEVNILKKEDGRLKGCCFVQFEKTLDASKAIKSTNAQPLLGRLVAVDWALPKAKFQESNIKQEPESDEEQDSKDDIKIKEEKDSDSAIESGDDEEAEAEEDSEQEDSGESEDEEGEDEEEEGDSDDDDEQPKKNNWEGERLKDGEKKKSDDTKEGKTIFLRNISLETTQEDLKAEMEKFGKVAYALLCIDKMLERPKGTGFVKFQTKESADACLEASYTDGIFLDGRQIYGSLAVSREEVETSSKEKKEKGKDKRNLYLAREGMVRVGTLAAEGVSRTDMDKRGQLDRLKRQLLRNLHMFISPLRLCVNNLPASVDDKQLKKLFRKYAPRGAVITEARVMKDLKTLNDKGKAVSKGYGFVAFTKHEDALAALRKINNNPSIFSANKRPIVEFSVENRTALRAREKRLERSKEVLRAKAEAPVDKRAKPKKLDTSNKQVVNKGVKEDSFTGAISDPKQKGLPTHMGPKIRHNREKPDFEKKKNKISRNALRKNKRLKRPAPEAEETAAPPSKKTKVEKKRKPGKAAVQDKSKFNSLVESYKAKLSGTSESRRKWFDS